jgi:serine/threonine protein kinase
MLLQSNYAASEQYGKAQTTASADIYSLGATLHQLVSGNDPSQDPFQFAPLGLSSQPGLASLETLIMQMVETNKDKRPSSMAAVKQELQRTATQKMTAPPYGIAIGTSIPSRKTKEQWLDEGDALFELKRYGEALTAYDQAIRLDPNLAMAYNNKGNVLDGLERP